MDAGVWRGRSVLITGHTGFKGSWLALWLSESGAKVNGFALPPNSTPNHWDLLRLDASDNRGDVRDFDRLSSVFARTRPEIVFHLAAQPLVRRSYRDPLETWSTNVLGTANVLEACRRTESVRAVLAVTTDKVYENREWAWGYRENDPLGGHDPYGASKAACELVVESYGKSFFQADDAPLLASVRAGNVVGGGDWSEDRLVPDLVRAAATGRPLEIRSPQATRPWQHVLDCLRGYLMLGAELLAGNRACAEPWNFGPDAADNLAVEEILRRLKRYWPDLDWRRTADTRPHEANLLYLDNAKAKAKLGWRPAWNIDQCLSATAQWYKHYYRTGRVISRQQLDEYRLVSKRIKAACRHTEFGATVAFGNRVQQDPGVSLRAAAG
ncbi:MAG: CDP-glucose 4,6-dehydratase [Pirellulales bacterium]|nr:CDP-glucose 4,6-dehydratase [Pirellulales bacterium]